MASAFLSQALREQAAQEARGQMMKDAIARRVSSQIMGQIAQKEVNSDLRREIGKGRSLEQAAGQEMRRDIGKTQLEMQKEQAANAKRMAIVGAAADSIGALISTLAEDDEEEFKLESPDTTLKASVPKNPEAYDLDPNYNPSTSEIMGLDVSKQLDASVPQLPEEYGQFVSPNTQLGLPGSPEEELAKLIEERDKDKRWMADLPPMPNQAGGM